MPTDHTSRYSHITNTDTPQTILIKDGSYVISADEQDEIKVERAKSIFIRNGVIEDIRDAGDEKEWLTQADIIYDAGLRGGTVITPGLINAHAHPPMYLLRSTTLLKNETATTEESLVVARKIERAMMPDDQLVSALGDFTEQQKMGTTTVLSHYHTPAATRAAARQAYIRLVDAISVASKTDPTANIDSALATFSDVDELISPGLTIHTMERAEIAQLADVKRIMDAHPESMLTIHCGETKTEVEACVTKHGMRPVEVLEQAGLLSERLVLSHAVHLTTEEIALLVKRKVGIAHLPTSNRIHKSGQFPYADFYTFGGTHRIALGTDSVISKSKLDIVSEALQSKIMHQDTVRPVSYTELFSMMTSNGARVVGKGKEIGKILPGYKADIAFWKLKDRDFIPYDSENPETLIGNLISHGGSHVRDLMINGRFVISGRYHQLVNESALIAELQKRHIQLRDRI